MRIDAPTWFERDDFKDYLREPRTATWNNKSEVLHPFDYADVFFTYCQGEGSDSPTPDAPTGCRGVPEEVWEELGKLVEQTYGTRDVELLVWVTNCE